MSASAARRNPWAAQRERSNALALRAMAFIALALGRRAARLLLLPITLYFLCFAPTAARHSVRFLARALGRSPTLADRWRHLHAFASVVLDRLYFVRGRLDPFDIRVSGGEIVDASLVEGRGAFLLGAHLGSFEALQAVGARHSGLKVAMAMYPDNAQQIQRVLQALAPHAPLAVIAIGRSGSTLAIRDWLDAGGLCGLLGDRHLGDEGTVALPFLGTPARFAAGPLRLAMLLRRRVIFMAGLYRGGNRYDVRFEVLADFTTPPADREAAVQAALAAYVARLEALALEVPSNWFNFYDFWHEDQARAA